MIILDQDAKDSSADSISRDLAYLGALITIVSVFFSAVTQNVLNTYTTTRDGRINGLDAGRVPRSENFNRTNQPLWTGLNFRMWQVLGGDSFFMLIVLRTTLLDRHNFTCRDLQRYHVRKHRRCSHFLRHWQLYLASSPDPRDLWCLHRHAGPS